MTAAHGHQGVHRVGTRDESHLELEVPARASSVGRARRAVATFLAANAVPSVVVDDLELVVSELVTNAVIHPAATDHPVRVSVRVGSDVQLDVAHHGSSSVLPPVEMWQLAPPTERSGRGLGIVRRLCDDVHVSQDGPWAVVACGRRLPDAGGAP
jgi:serine/threonine-protein kinase RsbW